MWQEMYDMLVPRQGWGSVGGSPWPFARQLAHDMIHKVLSMQFWTMNYMHQGTVIRTRNPAFCKLKSRSPNTILDSTACKKPFHAYCILVLWEWSCNSNFIVLWKFNLLLVAGWHPSECLQLGCSHWESSLYILCQGGLYQCPFRCHSHTSWHVDSPKKEPQKHTSSF